MVTKKCLITGASSGIGHSIALSLAKQGHTVILLCRDAERANTVLDEIRLRSKNNNVFTFIADLSSQKSIRNVVEEIKLAFNQLDILIHNAGGVSSTYQLTEDNIEYQFALNHIAPFLLTHYLLPLFDENLASRIICVNSRAHGRGSIYFDDINLSTHYAISKAYNQSKLANMLFTYSLADKLKGTQITVNTFHPGLVNTNFGIKGVNAFHALIWQLMRILGRSPEMAAEDALYLALEEEISHVSGMYFHQKKEIQSSKNSYNKEWQERIWNISLALTKIKADDYGKVS